MIERIQRRLAPAAALAACLLATPPPARAAIPTFDALTWIEQNLTKVEAWVQTATAIAEGDWTTAALYGVSGGAAGDKLLRIRRRVGRALSVVRRVDRLRTQFAALRSPGDLYSVNLPPGFTGSVTEFAIGEHVDWGSDQQSTAADRAFARILTRARVEADRISRAAERQLTDLARRKKSICGEGASTCDDYEQQVEGVRLEMRAAQAEEGLNRCLSIAEATYRAALAQINDSQLADEPDRAATAPSSAPSTAPSSGTADENFESSTAGLQARGLNLELLNQERERARVDRDLAVDACRQQFPAEHIAALREAAAEHVEAAGQARDARREFQSHVLSQARANCEGQLLGNLRGTLYGQSAAATQAQLEQCLQSEVDRVFDAIKAAYDAQHAPATLDPTLRPAL